MLKAGYKDIRAVQRFFTLHLFLSIIAFQSIGLAQDKDVKELTAEEYRTQGYIEHQKGNLNNALTLYNKAIALGLENVTVLNDLGILYEQIGLNYKAEQYYLKAVELDKEYLPAYMNLAYLYQKVGEQERALELFIKRYEMAGEGDPWKEKARIEILGLDPSYEEKIKLREEAIRTKEVKEQAEQLGKELIEKAQQEFITRVNQAEEHYKYARLLRKEGKFREALLEINLALRLTPDNPKLVEARDEAILEMRKENMRMYSERAIENLSAGDSLSAKEEVQKMLSIIPDDPGLNSK